MIPFDQKSTNIPAGYQDRVSLVGTPSMSGPMSSEKLQSAIKFALDEAVNFEESELTNDRITIDKYYQGYTSLPKPKGRSHLTVSAVRDAVKTVISSLARIFTQTDKVGEFYSDDEEDERICRDATTYVNSVFWKNEGYKALIMASTDALKAKVGIIKVSLENVAYTVHNTQTVPQMPMEMPMEMPTEMPMEMPMEGMEGMEDMMEAMEDPPPPGMMTETDGVDSVYTTTKTRLKWNLLCVPPDEFIISSEATTLEDARLVAHRRDVPKYVALAMGYDYETILGMAAGRGDDSFESERDERRRYSEQNDQEASPEDPLGRFMLLTEAFMRIDADGDGIAELRRIVCGGPTYQVLSDEPVNWLPFAAFSAELQPHMFYPICLAEDLMQDQDAQTALLRSIIDNTALVNAPRTEVNESTVNLDDVKNGQIGSIIRVRQMGQIQELSTPFVAGQTLPVLEYMQNIAQARSGVTKMSQGLDSDALQSTSRIAANAQVQGGDARIEMMARNIGETGVKSLFLCILRTAIYSIKGPQQIKVPEGFMTVRPEFWHDQMSVKLNVGLGSGRIDEKKQALMAMIPIQQQIVTQFGPANPVCSWTNMRNTIASLLRLSGMHNTTDFFPVVPPEQLQQLDQAQKQAAAQQSQQQQEAMSSQMKIMSEMNQVEMQKGQMKYQTDMAALQQKHASQMQSLQAQIMELQTKQSADISKALLIDDRERDKMQLQFIIDAITLKMDEQEVARAAAQAEVQSEASKLNEAVQ